MGKYEKVIKFGTIPIGCSKEIEHGIDKPFKIQSIESWLKNKENGNVVIQAIPCSFNRETITAYNNENDWSKNDCYIRITYDKIL